MSEHLRNSLWASAAAAAAAILLLFRPISAFETTLWGPADPWNNGDFLGAHWLFWAAGQPDGVEKLLFWPWGEDSLWKAFPNPFDAWLLSGILGQLSFPLGWNLMMLAHHTLNVVATTWLGRAAGLRPLHATAAGIVVAATPIMLLEHAMGHTLTSAVWPGVMGLAALLRGRSALAGILIGVQGLAYLYTGLFAGIVALIVRPQRGLLWALVVIAPYLLHLSPQLQAAGSTLPPDGFTGLPLDGLIGTAQQFQYRLFPWSLAALLAPLVLPHRGVGARLMVAAVVLLLVSLGPSWSLHRGASPFLESPLHLIFGLPGLDRMHHPARLALLAVPLLAVVSLLLINRARSIWALGVALACATQWSIIDNTAAWSASPEIPGNQAALWARDHAEAVVDLGSTHLQSLSLQTIHGKPTLAGLHPRSRPPPHVDAALLRQVELWARGEPQPRLPARLKQLGYSHVLVIDRGQDTLLSASAVQEQLGAPVFEGVFAL